MGKLLSLVLGLAVVSFLLYRTVLAPKGSPSTGPSVSEAKQTLDNVREKAREFEQQAQKKADDTLQNVEP